LHLANQLTPYADLRAPVLVLQVTDGQVRAQGQVGTIGRLLFLDKLLARVEGVVAIDLSGVGVESFATASRADDRIQETIFSLIRNPFVFPISGEVEVAVTAGDVVLTGLVPRLIDRMEAEKVARLVAGVHNILNEIEIEPSLGRLHVREPQR
jgi:osmotically-inducible protein OsmY